MFIMRSAGHGGRTGNGKASGGRERGCSVFFWVITIDTILTSRLTTLMHGRSAGHGEGQTGRSQAYGGGGRGCSVFFCAAPGRRGQHTLNPKPEALNPKPYTLNTKP